MRPQTSRFTFPCHFYSRELTPRRVLRNFCKNIASTSHRQCWTLFIFSLLCACFLHALAKNRGTVFMCRKRFFFWRGWSVKTRSISRESLTTESHTVSVPTSSGGVEHLHWKVIRGVLSRSGHIFRLIASQNNSRGWGEWVIDGIRLFILQSRLKNRRSSRDNW